MPSPPRAARPTAAPARAVSGGDASRPGAPWRQVLVVLLALTPALTAPSPAGAQTGDPATTPAQAEPAQREPAPPPRWALGGRFGLFEMVNSPDSYDAVYGDPMPQLGGQLELDLRRHLRFDLSLDYGFVDGEAVILTDPPRGTGIGQTLTLAPLHLTAAWRFRPQAAWDLYLGGGPSLLWAQIEDDGGASDSTTEAGGSAVLGLRRQRSASRWELGGELRWSAFPGVFSTDRGVGAYYDEDDAGGLALSFVALRRLGAPAG